MTEASGGSTPKRRSRTSFDFRLFAIFFFCWIVVGATPGTWKIENVLGGILIVFMLLVGLSIHHRRQLGWRWPGVKVWSAVAGTIFYLWFGALFFSIFLSQFNHRGPGVIAFLGCLGTFVLYLVLGTLNLVFGRKSDFLRYCHPEYLPIRAPVENRFQNTQTPEVPLRPAWHSAVHWSIAFSWLVVMTAGAGHRIYRDRLAEREQAGLAPERTEVIKAGRETIHVTPEEKERLTILDDFFGLGILAWLVFVFAARFLLGVELERGISTLPKPKVQPIRDRSP